MWETLLARAACCQHTPLQCLDLVFSILDVDSHRDILLGIYIAEVVGAGADALSLLAKMADTLDGEPYAVGSVFRHTAMGAIHGGRQDRIDFLLRDKDARLVAEQFTTTFLQTGNTTLMQWALDKGWIDLTPYIDGRGKGKKKQKKEKHLDPQRTYELREAMSALTSAGDPAPFQWLETNGLTIPSYAVHMACDHGKHAILVWLLDHGYHADDEAWWCAVTEGNAAVLGELYARNGGFVPSHLHASLRDNAENLVLPSSGEWLTAHGVP